MNITLNQYASSLYSANTYQGQLTSTTASSDSLSSLESDISTMADVLDLTSDVSIEGIIYTSDYVNYRYMQAVANLTDDESTTSTELSLLTGEADLSSIYTTGNVTQTALESIDEAAYETSQSTSTYSAYKSTINDQVGTLFDMLI